MEKGLVGIISGVVGVAAGFSAAVVVDKLGKLDQISSKLPDIVSELDKRKAEREQKEKEKQASSGASSKETSPKDSNGTSAASTPSSASTSSN